ncbi:E3 SUMO-protein ligase ZBED1-like isoform X1 [Entelurus aequoreus]|uniref:E3 SUMO-protein ligase ZBED1-like isoform X1 n=2 Tax=Entelurus aequoreus TaxID=161455 RepID=UPI002B1D7779|nr:E3 SUMO-protein ligase ZBED1-like isoform X1 [Entelurus aequoreus]XP_061893756.1 E3 SUMO-protein ligase ZBED1-like isoform X1 [Entelurus aequoreus]XP_061909910.1 E3 SUMO-protein ligase ZBED1-like isoform X1 [Entelurus aequoreus]XP_061912203.1 E3 SUMO-protein ligase ZBED1-like isoform X1 [Entelurus aequoreus]XP_061923807.1 E3 SUMO-protein ligase ZBED1-like isoform X1 [Entelurus aequoreus]
MKRRKRSAVWEHFTLKEDDATCKICKAVLKYNNSTSSLNYHLKSLHAAVLGGESGGGARPGQPSVAEAFSKRKAVCDDARAEGITQRICNMVEKDMLPISIVDGKGFRELMNYCEPDYQIPSRETITTRIEARYKRKKAELKARLANTHVAITTDCWTSNTTESYITVTCHYMEDWLMRSAVLATESMPMSHTADNLAERLNEIVHAWGLTGRVIACVHDNASNIVLANSQPRVDWASVPCYTHTLQLAINDGFAGTLHQVIAAAGRLVKHFKHSTKATKALETKQGQMGLERHQLIQSCKTRWNSVCDMFARLVEQRWAVCAVLSDRTFTKLSDARTLEIRDDHWKIMEEMGPVLVALKTATTVMSTETEVSISNTYPISFGLIDVHLKKRVEGDSGKVAEFKSKVAASLSRRMKIASDDFLTSTPMIATMVDPRHKHLSFLSPARRISANAKLLELAQAEDVSSTSTTADGASSASASTTGEEEEGAQPDVPVQEAAPQRHTSAMVQLLGAYYTNQVTNDVERELDSFLKDAVPNLDSDPTDWWGKNEARYPRLAKVAKRYMCIPATSVPSERVFSACGLTVTKLRSRLTPEHVDMLIYLNKNE